MKVIELICLIRIGLSNAFPSRGMGKFSTDKSPEYNCFYSTIFLTTNLLLAEPIPRENSSFFMRSLSLFLPNPVLSLLQSTLLYPAFFVHQHLLLPFSRIFVKIFTQYPHLFFLCARTHKSVTLVCSLLVSIYLGTDNIKQFVQGCLERTLI